MKHEVFLVVVVTFKEEVLNCHLGHFIAAGAGWGVDTFGTMEMLV